jgi:hypothetical protein
LHLLDDRALWAQPRKLFTTARQKKACESGFSFFSERQKHPRNQI